MHIDIVPNRGSPPAVLLRESYREDGKTKKRTLANLSSWPAEQIDQLRAVLRGERLLPAGEAIEIIRSLPHGHVLAALGTARQIDLDGLLPRRAPARKRTLTLALIIARLLDPAAKLATARMLSATTACHSLGEVLGLAASAPMNSMPPSTGWAANSRSSRPPWPGGISGTARCCSTMSPPPTSKGGTARWRGMVTAVTTVATARNG